MPQPVPLKLPADLPDSDIVIYDVNCKFCIGQVERLSRWDGADRLSFISLHDPFVAEFYPELDHDELMKQMYVIDRQSGGFYGGAKALRYLARKLPRLWFAMPFLHIPFTLPVWQWLYHQIAKRRYKISNRLDSNSDCSDDSCKIHLS